MKNKEYAFCFDENKLWLTKWTNMMMMRREDFTNPTQQLCIMIKRLMRLTNFGGWGHLNLITQFNSLIIFINCFNFLVPQMIENDWHTLTTTSMNNQPFDYTHTLPLSLHFLLYFNILRTNNLSRIQLT